MEDVKEFIIDLDGIEELLIGDFPPENLNDVYLSFTALFSFFEEENDEILFYADLPVTISNFLSPNGNVEISFTNDFIESLKMFPFLSEQNFNSMKQMVVKEISFICENLPSYLKQTFNFFNDNPLEDFIIEVFKENDTSEDYCNIILKSSDEGEDEGVKIVYSPSEQEVISICIYSSYNENIEFHFKEKFYFPFKDIHRSLRLKMLFV